MLAHNLTRELQMQTVRQALVHRAGRLIRPQGRLTLVLNGTTKVQDAITAYLSRN